MPGRRQPETGSKLWRHYVAGKPAVESGDREIPETAERLEPTSPDVESRVDPEWKFHRIALWLQSRAIRLDLEGPNRSRRHRELVAGTAELKVPRGCLLT